MVRTIWAGLLAAMLLAACAGPAPSQPAPAASTAAPAQPVVTVYKSPT